MAESPSAGHPVSFTSGAPETVLPPPDPEAATAVAAALEGPEPHRAEALRRAAARWPRHLHVWAALAETTATPVERYAFARVGYHRGLDALRAAGWRGSGEVRWAHEENQGFLRSLAALRDAAATIGEHDESDRCAVFLRQLDPSGSR